MSEQKSKVCARCKKSRPLDQFYREGSGKRAASSWCKECYQNKNLLKNFGMTLEEYDAMLAAQGMVCAICKTDNPKHYGRFVVDHCHKTQKVRGLVCQECNLFIGHLEKRREILTAFLEYLDAEREFDFKGNRNSDFKKANFRRV